ncbi:MAG TPA: EAL domain-containing protein, partial [Rhodoferax sp.]|nr:EAL domain-containing protein [Rhodoferax sp.]
DVGMDQKLQARRDLTRDLRTAVSGGQLALHYQPLYGNDGQTLTGYEALLRWQHPTHGLLGPNAFLPATENNPVSMEIGEWVIATALAQMAQWQQQGLVLTVSVNIAAYQLQQSNFAQRMTQLLAQQPSVKPDLLELEVLETSALDDMGQAVQAVRACQELGVRFALDDFGTGYSSLTHLRHLPAEVIKIDQSFVRDMLEDPDDMAIVQSVIGLARAFRRDVIAEGVETAAHGHRLLAMGCDLAQGYGIARPMPAADIPAWAAHWGPESPWAS